jgi:hypothetical protein
MSVSRIFRSKLLSSSWRVLAWLCEEIWEKVRVVLGDLVVPVWVCIAGLYVVSFIFRSRPFFNDGGCP